MDNKKAIIILGAPGSGKGTQANLLAEKFGFYHLETSKLIEKAFENFKSGDFIEADGEKYYFEKEKERYDTGELNSFSFVLYLIEKVVEETIESGKGIIFSGSPRTFDEAEKFFPFLMGLLSQENIKIFFLSLDVDDSVWRNSNRRVCELMNHSILYLEENKNLTRCPLDGSKLVKRSLDVPETIRKRFAVFERDTLPVLDYLKEQGLEFLEVDGRNSVADVFADILKALE